EEPLIALLEECERANAGAPITFFEITTAAAFLAFARTPADILLLEVGMGGRVDTTNVVARPAVTAITPVSIDHVAFLGNTLTAIAGEKAGILKPGVVGVIAPQADEAAATIAARAAAVGAPLYRAGREWHYAATAIACLENLSGFAVPAEAVAAGLRAIDWPARLQQLRRGLLVEALPPDAE